MPHKQFIGVIKSTTKVWMIIGIYLMHLLFLECVMANPSGLRINHFEHILAKHHHKKSIPHTLPAYYATLLKHNTNAKISFEAPVCYVQHTAVFDYPFQVILTSSKIHSEAQLLHLSDDAFERYRLHCSFLI